jgi:hypothetical protein
LIASQSMPRSCGGRSGASGSMSSTELCHREYM